MNEYGIQIGVANTAIDQGCFKGNPLTAIISSGYLVPHVSHNYIKIPIYPVHADAKIPVAATANSACFDFKYQPPKSNDALYTISGYDKFNNKFSCPVNTDYSFYIKPQDRMLVPTGLIFAIDASSYVSMIPSIRIYARSGLSLKKGLVIANGEGVIDADYREEVFVMLTNISDIPLIIEANERIAQGEVVWNNRTCFETLDERPTNKVGRSGGFGSTGAF